MQKKISAWPKPSLVFLSILFVIGIAYIDYISGPDLSFSLFYIFPILFITWIRGQIEGFLTAFVGTFLWFLADIGMPFPSVLSFTLIWNTTIRLMFFLLMVVLATVIRILIKNLHNESREDVLTGCTNSRSFQEILDMELRRSRRFRHPFSLAYIDLDNFKTVNDTMGHQEGDRVLKVISASLKKQIRKVDTFSRLGGDEFALLLPETAQEQAKQTFEKILPTLYSVVKNEQWPISFSIGVIICQTIPDNIETLMEKADAEMYSVKKSGKDNISYSVY